MCKNIYQETDWENLKVMISKGTSVERREGLLRTRDAIIGSNRQKCIALKSEIVPLLLNIITSNNIDDKTYALVILGSLAKGSIDQVQSLVEKYSIVAILIHEITTSNNDKKCIEISLNTLRSIYDNKYDSIDEFFNSECSLTYFINLASADSSLKTQVCVTSILVSICRSYEDQIRLLHAGTIHLLARMICYKNEQVQLPALRCLSCMCLSNRSISDNICVTSYQGKSLPDILNSLLSRLYPPEIQLTAARCLTYIYRSGTLPSSDHRILQSTLPTLARLCSEYFDESIRAAASATLSYLLEVDSELQQTAAISNHLIKSLSQLMQCSKPLIKQAALRCIASLAANDESIRKRIMCTNGLMDIIIDALNNYNSQLRFAALKCLHSLSRSVQQLRTTFQDYTVWKPLMQILSSQSSTEFCVAVTSIICNMLLEFSPSKEPMITSGIIEKLCQFINENDAALRLNSIWALMNMSFQTDERVKTEIVNNLGTEKILELLCDSDSIIVIKTMGLLRNLLSKSHHIDLVMNIYGIQLLQTLNNMLELSNSTSDIKEQVLCIIGNIAAEAGDISCLMSDKPIMSRLADYLFHPDHKLQAGSLYVIKSIVLRNDFHERYSNLVDSDILKSIQTLNKAASQNGVICDDYIQKTLKQIVILCKNFCPEI